jgi:TraT complement resistance protein
LEARQLEFNISQRRWVRPPAPNTVFFVEDFMKNKYARLLLLAACLAALAFAAGCAATTASIRYKDLKVENKMSASIFLQPVAPDKRTVFVQVRNSSDKAFEVKGEIEAAVTAHGYKVVQDPDKAQYMLQANILQVGLIDESALEKNRAAGFGGTLLGAGVGGAVGGWEGAAIGAAAAGVAEVISGNLVKVNTYSVITDLQVSERTGIGVSQTFKSDLKQGTGKTSTKQQVSTTGNWKQYQTRIVSSARKVDLTWPEAYPPLQKGIAQSVAGLF